ncbi:MAG: hypothetical protein KDJ19_00790 [Hyphomicrobiaceae bacterium]|nr:hypothetical protein [Hyphomicrobiaceae bacterium]MCC0024645.1 hypothetical protein [Hyphomicrobiaceae bacterium]
MDQLAPARPHEALTKPQPPRACDLTLYPKPIYRGERTCDADYPFAVRALCGRPRNNSTRWQRLGIIAARRLLNPLIAIAIGLMGIGLFDVMRQVLN